MEMNGLVNVKKAFKFKIKGVSPILARRMRFERVWSLSTELQLSGYGAATYWFEIQWTVDILEVSSSIQCVLGPLSSLSNGVC